MQDVRELSGGTFSVGPATLYTTIKKLSDQGLIRETSNSIEDRRRTYALTSAGKRLLGAEFIVNNNYLILHEGRNSLGSENRNESHIPNKLLFVRLPSHVSKR